MELLTGILSAFGLSASAGLNAYIPLLVIGSLAPILTWLSWIAHGIHWQIPGY